MRELSSNRFINLRGHCCMILKRPVDSWRNFHPTLVFNHSMWYFRAVQFLRLLIAISVSSIAISVFAEARRMDDYKSIIERNPFGLKDPPPPAAPPPKEGPKEVKKEEFYLTGISTMGDRTRPKAYILSKDASKKEYDQKYFNLTVGDRQGELSLLEVDAKGRRVRVAYLGEERWLSMKDNGVPAPAGPAPVPGMPNPGVIPGAPGAAPVPLPLPSNSILPSAHPQPPTYPNAGNAMRRTPRSSGYNGYTPGGYAQPVAAGMNSSLPSAPNTAVPEGPQTPEEGAMQVINLYANHQRAIQQGELTPPLPPMPK